MPFHLCSAVERSRCQMQIWYKLVSGVMRTAKIQKRKEKKRFESKFPHISLSGTKCNNRVSALQKKTIQKFLCVVQTHAVLPVTWVWFSLDHLAWDRGLLRHWHYGCVFMKLLRQVILLGSFYTVCFPTIQYSDGTFFKETENIIIFLAFFVRFSAVSTEKTVWGN